MPRSVADTPQRALSLTDRQRAFVLHFLKDFNATAAAKRAGYPARSAHSTGSELIHHPVVRQAIGAAINAAAAELGIDARYVLAGIKETAERCMQVAPVLDRKGNPVIVEAPDGVMRPAFTFDSKGALRAYELLGKHIGLFTEKVEVSGPQGGPLEISDTAAAARLAAIVALVRERERQALEHSVVAEG